MKAVGHGYSHVGHRRETNEDEFLVEPVMGLYAVADGMGGHAAGEVAARLAIASLRSALERMSSISPGNASSVVEMEARLQDAVSEANRAIWESIERHEERRGMGTTLVALVAAGDVGIIGHVGDSRAYRLRGNRLHRLTSDHSWVNEQVRAGLLTDEAAQRHPMRNIVTRALGSRQDVTMDLRRESFEPDDVYLLCSDGLNTMLTDEEIAEVLTRHRGSPETACRALVEAANARGGEDNTTVVLVAVQAGGPAEQR